MSAYLVLTPKNPEYSGKTMGIQFNMGRAIVSKETVSPYLGYTVEQVINTMRKDFGYEVQPLGGEVQYQHEAVLQTATIDLTPAPAVQPVAEAKPKEKRVRRRKGAEVQETA